MKEYIILNLKNKKYKFLIIATSYKDIFSLDDKIASDINLKSTKVMFDLLLINGLNENRFISGEIKDSFFDRTRYKIVKKPNEEIKEKSYLFFKTHKKLVEKTILSESIKYKIFHNLI